MKSRACVCARRLNFLMQKPTEKVTELWYAEKQYGILNGKQASYLLVFNNKKNVSYIKKCYLTKKLLKNLEILATI